MLTDIGIPFLRWLDDVVMERYVIRPILSFDHYLDRWRTLLDNHCPCGDCG
jgi:hypothetical protein